MAQPYVHIDLDKPRKLRFRHNDIADLELEGGMPLLQLYEKSTFHAVRLFLKYGIRHQDSTVSTNKAGELAQAWTDKGGTLVGLIEKIGEALVVSGISEKKKADEDEPTEGNAPADEATT